MIKEIEIHHSDHFTIHAVEVTCGTELMNLAQKMRQEHGALFATFGPVIARDADGLPDCGRKK